MEKNLYGGNFIVFEGLDGSGQSTQAGLLAEYFKDQGKKVLLTKEPTRQTRAGKKIRSILEEKEIFRPLELQKLFCEDRREHLKKEIIPALKKGKIVISDRYFFSTLALGGLDVPVKKLEKLNSEFLYPDRIFFLKVSPARCLDRIIKRKKEIELFEKLAKMKKTADNFRQICLRFPNTEVIDGEKTISEIHKKIRSFFEKGR